MMKKIILIVVILIFAAFSFSEIRAGIVASKNAAASPETSVAVVPDEPAAETEQAAEPEKSGMTEEVQKAFIMDRYDSWAAPWQNGTEDWYYTFTDLDHNGRLELITASLQGSGLFTYADVWEMNEDFSDLVSCTDNLGEGGSYPDIITEAVNCYHDEAADLYYYLFDDVVRSGMAEHWLGKTVLCLHDGVVEITVICSEYDVSEDPEAEPTVTYSDGEGNALTKEEFEQAVANWAVGKTMDDYTFAWKEVRSQD